LPDLANFFRKPLVSHKPLKILITAGPTIEPLDPVRFLSNRSSGKMGYALAEAARDAGHAVVLLSGPTALKPPKECELIRIKTARDLLFHTKREFLLCDILFMVAAVADYRPLRVNIQKIKKNSDIINLKLVKNPDILKKISLLKSEHQTVVGFAAETTRLLGHAQKKLAEKKLDWIVLNDVSRADIGFEADQNEVYLIDSQKNMVHFKKQGKSRLAKMLMAKITTAHRQRIK